MATVLVVVRPFAAHRIGDVIDQQERIDAVIGGEHAGDVVRVPRGPALAACVQRED